MKYKLAILAAFLMLVTGCTPTYNVASYVPSAENAETIKSYNLQPVSVGTFQASKNLAVRYTTRRKIPIAARKCVGNGAVYLYASPSFEDYIEKAFIEELTRAGIYDASSPLVLTGTLEEIDSSSTTSWDPGRHLKPRRWAFTLTLKNARNESFITQSSFSEPWRYGTGGYQCGVLLRIFAPAVQKLIADVIKNPKFREIAN